MSAGGAREVRASSKKGFDDAVLIGIERANQTLEHVSSAQVTKQGVIVRRGRVAEYWVILSVRVDAVVSVNDARDIVEFDRAAEFIFGYSRDEVLGSPLETLIPERFHADHERHVRSFQDSHAIERMMGERDQVWGRRKDGTEFQAEASIARRAVDGVPRYSVLLRDLSES